MNRPSRSRRLLAFGGLAGMLLAAGVGCSANNALIRGQSPDEIGVARAGDRPVFPVFRGQSPDARPKPSHNTKLVSHEGMPVSEAEFSNGAVMSGGYCPPGTSAGDACPPGGCPGVCLPGIPCPGIPCPGGACMGPTYSYREPGVPVYPPGTGPALTGPGSPGAVVQYPYYTTKGPDDFFLDQDGRF